MEQSASRSLPIEKQIVNIVNRVENTGYGNGYYQPVSEKLNSGVKEFIMPAKSTYEFGADRMAINFIIGKDKTEPSNSTVVGIEANLYIGINLPTYRIVDEKNNTLLDLKRLDDLMSSPPSLQASVTEKLKHSTEVNDGMKILMEHLPDVFNQFHVKHNPTLGFTVPEELTQQQAQMISASHIKNSFHPYFNLGPHEIYNMMRHNQPVLKTLYRKAEKVKPGESKTFKSWIRLNRNELDQDKNFKMEFVQARIDQTVRSALVKYNFLETQDDNQLFRLESHLKNGGLALVNLKEGDKTMQLLIGADPGYNMKLRLFTTEGALILDHNRYLKNKVDKVLTETLELKKNNGPTKPIQDPKVLVINSETGQIDNKNSSVKKKRLTDKKTQSNLRQ